MQWDEETWIVLTLNLSLHNSSLFVACMCRQLKCKFEKIRWEISLYYEQV